MKSNVNRLNIRVYGLLINEANEILLVHEKIGPIHFTKFPGGGLEFGEGIKDCLIREYREEAGIDIELESHFYTTDFFLASAFRETDQLVSVYYKVKALTDVSLIPLEEFDIENDGRIEQLRFFWVPLKDLHEDMVTFPIDKVVAEMLRKSVVSSNDN